MKKIALLLALLLLVSMSAFAGNSHSICPEAQISKVSISQRNMGKTNEVVFEIVLKNISSKDQAYMLRIISDDSATIARIPVNEEKVVKAGAEEKVSVSFLKEDFPDKFSISVETE